MNYCPECGEEVEEDSKFCPNCGYSLEGEGKPREGQAEGKVGKIGLDNILARPSLIMGVSGVLMLVGAIGTWYTWGYGGVTVNWSGGANGIRAAVGIMGLIMLYSSIVDLGYVDVLKEAVPPFTVSAVCGAIALFGSLGALSSPVGSGWGLFVTLIASLIALFSSYRFYALR